MSDTPTHKAMSIQHGPDTGKPKASPSWLQRMAANLGFASTPSLRETLKSAIDETRARMKIPVAAGARNALNVLDLASARVRGRRSRAQASLQSRTTGPSRNFLPCSPRRGHSRVPVFHESLDDPLGMVHIKDAMAWATQEAGGKDLRRAAAASAGFIVNLDFGSAKLNTPIAETGLTREVLFVPPSMPVPTLLAKMKSKKIHLALVVDEFGGTDGLVSFGDLVEAIVGDFEDEHGNAVVPSIACENRGVCRKRVHAPRGG